MCLIGITNHIDRVEDRDTFLQEDGCLPSTFDLPERTACQTRGPYEFDAV